MNLVLILFLIPYIMAIQTQNGTEEVKNSKMKRTASNQIRNPGENRPIFIYDDNAASPGTLTGFYAPISIKPFDVESPKQVAAQQVLYEFQQTPTNAVSNVHVNQFLQPLAQQQAGKQDGSSDFSPNTSPQEPLYQQSQPVQTNRAPNQYGSQPIASPVHHSAFVRHGQNLAQVNFQPLGATLPHHIQTQQYVPGKYLYVNGKIIHQPGYNNQQYQQPPHQQYQQFPLNPSLQKPYYNPKLLPQKLMPPPPPQRFHPPQRHQIQQITKPISPPEVTEEQNEEEPEDENAPVRDGDEAEASEESDDNRERYEEAEDDDEEKEGFFGRYHFDEEEDDRRKDEDKDRYREESEEDDSDRGSSRYSPKRYKYNKKSKPIKQHKSDKYAYSESYSTNSRYGDEKPKKRAGGKKASSSSPKTHYKAYKFSKNNHGKPRYEKIEGKFSENIPIVQKQKILQEKWYVTSKSSDELH